ncbi:MAG: nucleotide exchange factor GrpE [Burkholderiales bacterium]
MTRQSNDLRSRLKTACRILLGSGPQSGTDPRNRIAALELDLVERETELARVREEYERLRAQAERDQAGAASAGFEALARRLAPLLSQLATMQSLADGGRPVRIEDVLKLSGKLERVLNEAGLARIGTVGEEIPFDTRSHQRMSGADLEEGDPVSVRFVGYRLGATILVKALVSRTGAAPESRDGESPGGESSI